MVFSLPFTTWFFSFHSFQNYYLNICTKICVYVSSSDISHPFQIFFTKKNDANISHPFAVSLHGLFPFFFFQNHYLNILYKICKSMTFRTPLHFLQKKSDAKLPFFYTHKKKRNYDFLILSLLTSYIRWPSYNDLHTYLLCNSYLLDFILENFYKNWNHLGYELTKDEVNRLLTNQHSEAQVKQ